MAEKLLNVHGTVIDEKKLKELSFQWFNVGVSRDDRDYLAASSYPLVQTVRKLTTQLFDANKRVKVLEGQKRTSEKIDAVYQLTTERMAELAAAKAEVERLRPFTNYLKKYDSKAVEWSKNKEPLDWLTKLQDEVDEVEGVLEGTHNDSLLHELLQVATIAFHWGELVIANARGAKAALPEKPEDSALGADDDNLCCVNLSHLALFIRAENERLKQKESE